MYGHGGGLEEYDINNEMERIKVFLNSGYSFADIVGEYIDRDVIKKTLFFSVGIEYKEKLFLYDSIADEWKGEGLQKTETIHDKYEQIEQHFLSLSGKEKFGYKICRCLAGIKTKIKEKSENPLVYQVYYMVLMDISIINPMFLQCLEAAYYKWLSVCLISALSGQNSKVRLEEKEKRKLQHDVSEKFSEYMLEMIGIDVEIITALSGIYYESEPCSSALVFLVSDAGKEALSKGVAFKDPVECRMGRIKEIRKLLQMGTEKQCLLIERNDESWLVKGLCQVDGLTDGNIIFRIRSHMVWNMEVGEQLAVCYECGNYCIEHKEFEWNRLVTKYKEVFGKKPTTKMKDIFSEARNQKHGTVLVMIQENSVSCAKEEVNRLVKESAGIKIENRKLQRKFVKSLTAIDGALIMDDRGQCYGFAMILDGCAKIQGNPERGARFNSTRRYIKTCKNQGMKVVGVVISEDGMMDIFTTEDEFEEENGKNGTE